MNRTIAILAGIAVYLALKWINVVMIRMFSPTGAFSLPLGYVEVILRALVAVAPGFTAVWLFKRRGFVIGTLTGVLAEVVAFVLSPFLLNLSLAGLRGPAIWIGLAMQAIAAGFTNGIAGMAAELAQSRRSPSNNTIERDARKSSARPSL